MVAGHGAQASLARELKVDPSRISQIKSSATRQGSRELYVAGVLGQPGTLERRGPDTRLPRCLRRDGGAGSGTDHRTARAARDRRACGEGEPRRRGSGPTPGSRLIGICARKDKRSLREKIIATCNSARNSRRSSRRRCTPPKSPSRVRSVIPIRIARSTATPTIRSTIASSGISSGHERREFESRILRSERSE